ncbi:hypothetical protein [Phytohabitans suffuscus]|uniref:Tryptophan--tRNA ligase n=1 Tax=Phytohabitans suffuscus TaxID=624315 RepID=A0A6F8YEN5_9ACTN|nr:hypothetical protein [Phytohabitans suffuscus]BCB84479.1 hypothetical protein Psuf_017920 [Phytohabitans suffuscus]
MTTTATLTGFKPTGHLQLGNLLGAIRPVVAAQERTRAVTDSGDTVRYEPAAGPGVANLLEILAGCAGGSPAALASGFTSYGALKRAVAEAVVATVRPVQVRFAELSRDPGYVRRVLADGAERARDITAETVHRARRALGLIA